MCKSVRKHRLIRRLKRIGIAVILLVMLGVLCLGISALAEWAANVFVSVTPDWEEPAFATVVTIAPLSHKPPITITGDIEDTGGSVVTKRGFVWSLESHAKPSDIPPEDTDYEYLWIEEGEFGEGEFHYQPPDLIDNTDYYGRAVVLNSVGWSYGNEIVFDPIPSNPAPTAVTIMRTVPLILAGAICFLVFNKMGAKPIGIFSSVAVGLITYAIVSVMIGIL